MAGSAAHGGSRHEAKSVSTEYNGHIRDELVAGAFASLPEQEQQILILRFVAAMADGEIGGLVEMSRSAVQCRRTKTLNELRQRLEDSGGRNAK